MREAEQRLKAIPQFCFPDAKDWSPVSEYSRYGLDEILHREGIEWEGNAEVGYT